MVLRNLLRQALGVCASVLVGVSASHLALAEDVSGPRLEIEAEFELESDTTVAADDSDERLTDNYNTSSFALGLYLSDALSVQAGLTFEPVKDPRPGKDRTLTDHGLYVEELYVRYERAGWAALAGKFNPAFGVAWDRTPGVFGADLAEDYQLTERIGGALSVTLPRSALGEVEIAAAAFNLDTSQLSKSFFTDRGRAHALDGGPGNADDLSSFSLAATAEGLAGVDGLGWHIAYRYLARGETADDVNGEHGIALGLFGSYDLGDDRGFGWIGEYVHLDGADGADLKLDYMTLGAQYTHGRLSFAASTTQRFSSEPGSGTDALYHLSAGFEFVPEWTAEIGWKHTRFGGFESDTIGIKVAHALSWTLPLR